MKKIAVVLLVFLIVASTNDKANAVDISKLTKEEIEKLPKEELLNLPAIEILSKAMGQKNFDSVFILFMESMLSDLKFYNKLLSGKQSLELDKAIKDFQKSIKSKPTGILLVREFDELTNRIDQLNPKLITASRASVINVDNLVHAQGTWVFEHGSQASPIQTSKIHCNKQNMQCIEAVAEITNFDSGSGGEILSLYIDYLDITKWDVNEVVAEESSSLCVAYTLTINLKEKKAFKFRRRKAEVDEMCKGIATKPQILKLVDGFKVGWDFHKKREKKALEVINPEYTKHIEKLKAAFEK